MADTKISGLSAVTSLQATDEFVLARAGTTNKITALDLSVSLSPKTGFTYPFLKLNDAATGQFTNLGAGVVGAVSDPNYRTFLDLENVDTVAFLGRIGGSLVAATKLRLQYHTSNDPTVTSADAGWTTMATSAGSHTLNALFWTGGITIPSGALINPCQVRAVLFDGDGAADPTMSCLIATFYKA